MKQKKSIMYIFLEGAAALLALLMLGIFPLYFHNNYIDISDAKLSFFRVCSIGLIIVSILFICMAWLQQYKEEMKQNNKKKKKKVQSRNSGQAQLGKDERIKQWIFGISATTWFAVIFAIGILVATVFSANPQESWLGNEGRKLGAVTWLLCIAMYGIIGKYLKPAKWTAWVFLIVNMLVFLLTILNFWAIDPLGMYKNLSPAQQGSFISTIGNINACSSYLCMALPAGMALYALTKDIYLRAASALFLLLGFFAGYCAHSESWLLGLGAAFVVMLWFGLSDYEHMRRVLEIFGFFWLGSVLMKVMMLLGASGQSSNLMYLSFNADKLHNGIMLSGYVLAAEGILIAGILFLVWSRKKAGKGLRYPMIRRVIFIALAAVAAVGILLLVIANVKKGAWEGTFAVLEHLRLQDSFGSGRGYIWRMTVQSWLELPLWDKITGYGVNYYHVFIQQYGGAEVSEFFGGAMLVDAHNELMQIMTTMGLLGVIGYFGLLISTAVKSAKNITGRPALLMGVAVVCGYMAQGLVNNPTVFLTPYLFLMLGIIKSMEKVEDAGE